VRERARIGRDTTVGRGSAIDNDVEIGDRVRIQTDCYITAFSTVEDDVFIGPGVFTYNDNAMGRHGKATALMVNDRIELHLEANQLTEAVEGILRDSRYRSRSRPQETNPRCSA
jgi:acyl-[acyl carrier protein]--UDP-N-acetylglucosamine O-acyltransferase